MTTDTSGLPFSTAVHRNGFTFFSGQIGLDPETGTLPEGGAAQARQALRNLTAAIEAAGLTLADVVRVGVYLADMGDYVAVNEVYAEHFPRPYPARTAVGVAALPLGAAVEFDAIAG